MQDITWEQLTSAERDLLRAFHQAEAKPPRGQLDGEDDYIEILGPYLSAVRRENSESIVLQVMYGKRKDVSLPLPPED